MLQFTTLAGLLALAAVAVASPTDADSIQWESYKAEHGKRYPTAEEETRRMQIFLRNVRMVEEHNELYEKGLSLYKLGINHLSDMESSELGGLDIAGDETSNGLIEVFDDEDLSDAPAELDWREEGAVTDVKDQGYCKDCYTFSTTGAVEGANYIATRQLVSLSEQQILDCAKQEDGCQTGGLMREALQYIQNNNGIDTEDSYPYQAEKQQCYFKNSTIGATVSNIAAIRNSELALQKAVSKFGPISIGISANPAFQQYTGGIFHDDSCKNQDLSHGVLLVGYGTEDGTDYWIVKNSWGTWYGENGYIRMKRGVNICQITAYATAVVA